MSSEVGSGHVSIFPVLTGFKARVTRETKDAGASGAKSFEGSFKGAGISSGRALGTDLKKALSASAGDLGAAETKKLTGAVASASAALAKARLKQQDDAGRVRIAETRLAEAIEKSGEGSSQAVAAEERLASARRAHASSTDVVTAATKRLREAQGDLHRAQTAAAASADETARGVRRLVGNFRDGFRNAGAASSAFSDVAGSIGGITRALSDMTGLSALGRGARLVAQNVATSFTSMATMVGGKLAKTWAEVQRGAAAVSGRIGAALAPVTRVATATGRAIATPFINLGRGVATWMSPLTTQVSAAFTKIRAAAGPAASGMVSSFKAGAARLGSAASSAFSSVVSAASNAGQSAGRALSAGIRGAATAGVTAVAAGIGVAFAKGVGRLGAIDTAQAKLRGLGNDAKTVKAIMGDALSSVRGTAFGLGEAATVAASAVAAGIKPGQQLQGHLKSIANNASAAGISMDEMGSIFNKAATQANGVQNDVIGQLADKGIPIYQALAKEMGVTAGEVFKMASEGKVDFATFSKAATAAAGTVAKEMGNTVPGAAKNFLASMGRIGANALAPVYSKIAPLIQAATSALGPIEERAKVFGDILLKTVGPALDWLTNLFAKLGEGASLAQAGFGGLSGLLAPLAGAFAALGAGGLAGLLTKLPLLGGMLGGLAGPLAALGGPLGIVAAGLGALFLSGGDLGQVSSAVTGLVSNIVSALPGLVQQVAAFVPKIVSAILAQVPALLTAGLQIVTTLIQGIVSAVPVLVQGALSLITGLTSAIIANLPMIVQGALALVTGLVQGLITALPLLIQGAVTLVTALVNGLITMLPAIVQGGLTLLTGLLTAIVTAIPLIVTGLLQLLPQLITTLLGMLPSLLETGVTLFVGIITALVEVIPQLISTLVGMLPQILETLVGMLPQLLETGVQLFIQLVTAVVKVLPKLLSSIIGMLPKIISSIIGMIPQLLKGAIDLFTSLVKALPVILPELIGALLKLGPELVGAIISLIPQLLEAGKDIVRGLANGIRDAGQVVLDAIGGVVNGAIDWAKGLLGIKSPSRVFMAIGKYVGQGFVKGVNGTREQVSSSMTKLVDLVKSSFDKVIDERKSANAKLVSLEKKRAKIDQQLQDARTIKSAQARARRVRDLNAARADVSKQISDQRKLVAQYKRIDTSGRAESALLKRIATDNKRLSTLARQRESVTALLKSAQEKLKGLQDERAGVIKGIQSSAINLGDIGGQTSARGMIRNLQQQVQAVKDFGTKLKQLRAQGLDDASRDQLVADFQQNGSLGSVNGLLKGGPEAVKQIGKLQGELSAAGKSLGTYVGDDMYKAGINAAQGLVKGLESQIASIDKASKRIADSLVKAVKRALQIKSPSRVTMALGGHTGEGFAIGLEEKIARVQQAAERMLPRINPAPIDANVTGQPGSLTGAAAERFRDLIVNAAPNVSPKELAELIAKEFRWA